MTSSDIKRNRVMKFFIDACKEILETEGIKSVSARKVAEKAGYSYATIYNYFKDMDTLIAYCIAEYLEESAAIVEKFMDFSMDPAVQLIEGIEAYVRYYCESPQKFTAVFTMQGFSFDSENIPKEILESFKFPRIAMLHLQSVSNYPTCRGLSNEKLQILSMICSNFLHGSISFHIYRDNSGNIDDLVEMVKTGYKHILGGNSHEAAL